MMNLLIFSTTGGQYLFYAGCLFFGFLFIFWRTSENKSKKTKNKTQQELINFEYVSKIIDGNYVSMIFSKKAEIKILFAEWQKIQTAILNDASKENIEKFGEYIKNNDLNSFKPIYSSNLPDNISKMRIFIKDAFSEPFPYTHDFAEDKILAMEVTNIFVLKGITPEQSKKFFVHIKNHLVNHNMIRGIIHFDIYQNE